MNFILFLDEQSILIQLLTQLEMHDLNYHHADEVQKSAQGHSLFVGDVSAAEDIVWLKANNIKTVMTVASGFNLKYDSSIKQIKYDLQDKKTQNISLYFDMAAFQIEKFLKHHSILVHCGAGVSRSPTLVIAYLIKYKNMTFLQALKQLKSKRPQICPNLGFELQLKSYQKNHNNALNYSQKLNQRQKKQLPEIVKYQPNMTKVFNRSFHNELTKREGKLMLSKSLKPFQQTQKKQLTYLRKMAQFRFGITNMSRWKISEDHKEKFKKPFQL